LYGFAKAKVQNESQLREYTYLVNKYLGK